MSDLIAKLRAARECGYANLSPVEMECLEGESKKAMREAVDELKTPADLKENV